MEPEILIMVASIFGIGWWPPAFKKLVAAKSSNEHSLISWSCRMCTLACELTAFAMLEMWGATALMVGHLTTCSCFIALLIYYRRKAGFASVKQLQKKPTDNILIIAPTE